MSTSPVVEKSILISLIEFKIPAGFPSPAADYMEESIDIVKQLIPHPTSTFFARSEGDSMIDAHIPPGSILIIDRSLTAKNGDVVLAHLEGGWTVKYLRLDNARCWLVPSNSRKKKYQPIEITEEMEMTVWGVVTNVIIDTKIIRLCTL